MSAKHKEVCEAAGQWEDDTGEVLQWYGLIQDHLFTWGGQILPERLEPGWIRLVRVNVRHLKGGGCGTVQAQDIWDWCSRWSATVVAMSDHYLLTSWGGAGGKWDVAGVHGLQ